MPHADTQEQKTLKPGHHFDTQKFKCVFHHVNRVKARFTFAKVMKNPQQSNYFPDFLARDCEERLRLLTASGSGVGVVNI